MLAILTLLVVVTLSILITRIAAIALTQTGLSHETARFQARSAFTGAGFTTNESEKVVNHPVRRRIVLALMLLGNAGIITAVSSLILGFVGEEEGAGDGVVLEVVLLVVGLVALWGLATSRVVERRLNAIIERVLHRTADLDTRDYASLLQIGSGYRLAELSVVRGGWLDGRSLGAAQLRDEGVVVLGIERPDGHFLGAPDGDTGIEAGDTLYVYGTTESIASVDARRRGGQGDDEHDERVEEHEDAQRAEQVRDPRG